MAEDSTLTARQLAGTYPIISDQIKRPALEIVLTEFDAVLRASIPGDIVEFGCYVGTTSLFLQRLLESYRKSEPGRIVPALHVYDSFKGLPAKQSQDVTTVGDDFQAGELQVSKKQLLGEFHKARLDPPVIHKGWFGELESGEVPDTIAFGFLDGDFYESIIDSLRLVWPRLQPGGTICIDDYQRETLPGVERAVRDYFQAKPMTVHMIHNIGIIRKPGPA